MPTALTQRPPSLPRDIQYRGRFAPSPSGLLHFGSLIAALASFLDAKSCTNAQGQQGKWLVRIEDIDPPREQAGASSAILATLDAFGLHWDEEILYQSKQSQHYRYLLNELDKKQLSYHCQCTRAQIKSIGGIYQGYCRTLAQPKENSAIRLKNHLGLYQFDDIFQGRVYCDQALANEDFTIHRKDGLFAYQLAVVADDIEQSINHVIRGCDLLEPTARQLTFFSTLAKQAPQYGHIPLAITTDGYKLSKQNKAAAIDNNNPQPALVSALAFLGQVSSSELTNNLKNSSVDELILWAINNWQRDKVPVTTKINID